MYDFVLPIPKNKTQTYYNIYYVYVPIYEECMDRMDGINGSKSSVHLPLLSSAFRHP